MTLQRACDGANQARNKLSNGPLRAQGNGSAPGVFCDVGGRRHLPGICWYPAKRTEQAVNQGGTADNVNYSSLTEFRFLSGTFLFSLSRNTGKLFLTRRWVQLAEID